MLPLHFIGHNWPLLFVGILVNCCIETAAWSGCVPVNCHLFASVSSGSQKHQNLAGCEQTGWNFGERVILSLEFVIDISFMSMSFKFQEAVCWWKRSVLRPDLASEGCLFVWNACEEGGQWNF